MKRMATTTRTLTTTEKSLMVLVTEKVVIFQKSKLVNVSSGHWSRKLKEEEIETLITQHVTLELGDQLAIEVDLVRARESCNIEASAAVVVVYQGRVAAWEELVIGKEEVVVGVVPTQRL